VGVPEAVRLSGLSRSTLYKEMQEGRLGAIKMGRRRLIRLSELHRWLGSQPKA
jgi:excisionase family DNA binding protein